MSDQHCCSREGGAAPFGGTAPYIFWWPPGSDRPCNPPPDPWPSPRWGSAPIPFTLYTAGTGRAEATDVSVPAPGRWRLELLVRTGEFDGYSAATTHLVR